MQYSVKEIKSRAKAFIKAPLRPAPLAVALVFTIVTAALSFFLTRLGGATAVIDEETMMEFSRQAQAGLMPSLADFYNAVEVIPPETDGFSSLLQMAMEFITILVAGGFSLYALRITRGQRGEIGNLLDGFARLGRLVAISVLRDLAVTFGFICFVIPGFRLLYGYRQAVYLMWDHPDWTAVQCLRYSRLLMKGRRWKLFELDLSFLGWAILAAMPFSLAGMFLAAGSYGYLIAALMGGCVISAYVSLYTEFSGALWYNLALGLTTAEEKPPWEY